MSDGAHQEAQDTKQSGLRASAASSLLAAAGFFVALLISGAFSARALGPTDRGYYTLLIIVPSVVCQIGALGVSLAISYYVASGRTSAGRLLFQMRTVFVKQALLCALGTLAAGLLLNIGHPAVVVLSAVLVATVPGSIFIREYSLAVVQATGHSVTANALKTFAPLTGALTIAALYFAGVRDLLPFVVAYWANDWWTCIVLVAYARRAIASEPNNAAAVTTDEVLAFGRRGFLSYLSPLDTFRLDQLIVGIFLSPTALGYYSAGAAFRTIPQALAQSIGLTASPFMSRVQANRHISMRVSAAVFAGLAIGLSLLIAIAVEAAAPWFVPFFYGQEFEPAIPIARILIIGGFLFATRRIVVDIFRGLGRVQVGLIPEMSGLVTFGAMCLFLAPTYAEIGIAWAFTAAAAVNVTVLAVSQFRYSPSRATR